MKDMEKIKQGVILMNSYLLPLAETGAKASGNPYDNLVVALLKGGLPEVVKEIERLEGQKK